MRKQLNLNLFKGKRGGRRPGSGRKRIHSKGVAHRARDEVVSRKPLHINFKYRAYIRSKQCLRLLKRAILNSRKHGLKVIHFSLQSNHIHLIVEAESNEILTKGMRSMTVTFAKGLQKGRVQLERYHLHVLRSVRETRNAVFYVLFNQQKHQKGTYSKIDEFSSVLGMKNLIREFARRSKVTLEIRRGEVWKGDEGNYLIKRALVLECPT